MLYLLVLRGILASVACSTKGITTLRASIAVLIFTADVIVASWHSRARDHVV